MKSTMLSELVYDEVVRALVTQNKNGSMPAGHNGPYKDPETEVRNTGHWLFTFSAMYERTGEERFKKAAFAAVNYLSAEVARPMNATFLCRTNPEKDFTNGVIGQAWVMEALLKAWKVFGLEECYTLANIVYELHPWMPKLKAWRIVNVEGSYNTFDRTFNHQLWFAAVISLLENNKVAQQQAKEFLEYHFPKLYLYKNGILFHSTPFIRFKWNLGQIDNKVTFLNRMKPFFLKDKYLYKKSAGYHAFNLYAFAILKEQFPELTIWQSQRISQMLDVLNTTEFQKLQKENKYSFPYNPTGIEAAYALEVFKPEAKDEMTYWLKEQYSATNNPGDSLLTRGTDDINTARARIYEAMRLRGDYSI